MSSSAKIRWPKDRLVLIGVLVLFYIAFGVTLKLLLWNGMLEYADPVHVEVYGDDTTVDIPAKTIVANLEAAQQFVQSRLVRDGGHVQLYVLEKEGSTYPQFNNTNSEAVSYYLLWTAQKGDRRAFDDALEFMEAKMLSPEGDFLYWRLEPDGSVIDDGGNIASDADLRAIKALLEAERRWNDTRYTQLIDRLASGLEHVAVTRDGYLAPYGGGSKVQPWSANVVWLSYEDFVVFKELSHRRGEPWTSMYAKMKDSTLRAQLHNGLYNSELTENRAFGNGIDGGGYSINSMWMMIRSAESDDPELLASANKSLQFYKKQYEINAQLFALYSSNGDPLSPNDAPWVYALVGRAAVALGDKEFSQAMVSEVINRQIMNDSLALNGAIPEGPSDDLRVGQFTMQESVLLLQEYVMKGW